ncbi:SGNH/GDSL hydrolase family protein [Streptomyces sp. NPDC041068]|uniref:SGNH/GDSL hydrolase family protein n=1 Tax=Streptomyces sp. NPDC041068 TaxID=3155130 RepID=UPI0033DE594F
MPSPTRHRLRAATAAVALALALAASSALATALPAHAGPLPAPEKPRKAYEEYVALGDSWSADVALLTNVSTEHTPYACFQSTWNYPKKVAQALGVKTLRDATCGAATTEDFDKAQDINHLGLFRGTNPRQFGRLSPRTDLVTIGIGGNDAGLAGAAASCFNLLPSLELAPGLALPAPLGGQCKKGWVDRGVDLMSQRIATVDDKVYGALKRTHALSPDATVLVVDYLAGVPIDRGCYPYVQVNDGDLMWLGEKLKEINGALAEAVRRAKADIEDFDVRLVDTYSGSVGHDVCKLPGTKWVEGFIPLTTNPPGLAVPLHPNELGADHQAATVLKTLGKN